MPKPSQRRTSARDASLASHVLRSKRATKAEKSVAASDLSQRAPKPKS